MDDGWFIIKTIDGEGEGEKRRGEERRVAGIAIPTVSRAKARNGEI